MQLASQLWSHMPAATGAGFYETWLQVLLRSMESTAKSPDGSGLLWSNTFRPNVGYGFEDAEIMSGKLFYTSVLYWNASRLVSDMARQSGDAALATKMDAQAAKIQAAVTAKLWNQSMGVFMASTGIENASIDVWGNALAGGSGFATAQQSAKIFQFFKTREADIFYEGSHVRQVPKHDNWSVVRGLWDGMLYREGGFWATPNHHVLPFLAQYNRGMGIVRRRCGLRYASN